MKDEVLKHLHDIREAAAAIQVLRDWQDMSA